MILQVNVTLSESGQIAVQSSGPAASNQLMVLGLLDVAKATLMKPPPEQSIETPTPAMAGLLTGRNGR